jgi:hypothetical protein
MIIEMIREEIIAVIPITPVKPRANRCPAVKSDFFREAKNARLIKAFMKLATSGMIGTSQRMLSTSFAVILENYSPHVSEKRVANHALKKGKIISL